MKTILTLLAITITSLFLAGEAQAGRAYLSGSIRNDTKATVVFQAKLNTGNWVTFTLRPGHRYYLRLPNTLPLPKVTLRFDRTLEDSFVSYGYASLDLWGTDDPNSFKPHYFKVGTNASRKVLFVSK